MLTFLLSKLSYSVDRLVIKSQPNAAKVSDHTDLPPIFRSIALQINVLTAVASDRIKTHEALH